jgi:hypothetical protein
MRVLTVMHVPPELTQAKADPDAVAAREEAGDE